MSKRFGRKQKRTLRAQVNQLNQKIENDEFRIAKLKYIVDRCKDWDRQIISLLGKDTAFRLFPNEIIDKKLEKFPDYYQRSDYNLPATLFSPDIPFDMSVTIHNFMKIMLEFKRNEINYKHILRVKVGNGKIWEMYVDEEYLHRNGFTEEDKREFAYQLVNDLFSYANSEIENDNKEIQSE